MDYRTMQTEHAAWLEVNFPGQRPIFPAVGMLEEAGELIRSFLKMSQNEIWGHNHDRRLLRRKLIDDVGDCAIFVCSLANSAGWDFAGMVESAKGTGTYNVSPVSFVLATRLVDYAVSTVRACHPELAPGAYSHARVFLAELVSISRSLSIDFDNAVSQTWAIVKTRRRTVTTRPKIIYFSMEHDYSSLPVNSDAITIKGDGDSQEIRFRKIDLADEVWVVGPGDPAELVYAQKTCKTIRRDSCESQG